ncbi:hypothetical protein [Microbacterium aurugineum]
MTSEDELNPWAEIVGPCYTAASIARVLGWTEAEVTSAGDSLRLLALETDEGGTLYPSFQLHGGHVVDGLTEVLRVLSTGTNGRWTWAQWLNTALPEANPPRNIEALRAGLLEQVLVEARHDAWSWSS